MTRGYVVLLAVFLSGCACTQDVAKVGAANAVFGNDPITLAADMVAEGIACN